MDISYSPFQDEPTIQFRFPLDEFAVRLTTRRIERRQRDHRSLHYPWETDSFLAALVIRVQRLRKGQSEHSSLTDLATTIHPPYFLAYVLALGCGIVWCQPCQRTYHARELTIYDWHQSHHGEDFCCPRHHAVYTTITRFGPAYDPLPPITRVKREQRI